ncbi:MULTISPECIES: YitT family protein [unclassified Desulfovibrio]|uniref:YitT family protein n=1 Tax=unclassified Desulfovibrio TaxID=2593640 RepID=UPI0013EDA26E|nr:MULTISPECIES: YitT family protein [unclassified Desulfovibrio]
MKLYTYNRRLAESVWWNLLWLTLGALLVTVCIQSVAAPHDFLAGGILGVALLIWYCTDLLTPLSWYLLLSVPICVWGWFFVGRRFLLYTAYGTVCTFVFGMFITFRIPVDNELYAAVVAGVLHGAGVGIMLRTLGSGGGTDIIAVALKERWNIPIGQFSFGVNALIFMIGAFRLSLDLIVASMIMMFISANTLEYVLGMFNRRKLVLIISDHGEEIGEGILVSERFGATMLRGKGAYSGSDREILLTVTNNVALKRLENLVYAIDPHALFIVENTFYVSGGQFARRSY